LGPWFHNIHITGETQTFPDHPLGDFPYFKWKEISGEIPLNLSNWRILDIGCNAGFYSVELAKRGGQVTAIDCDEHYLRQARFIAGILDLSPLITFKRMQVYDLAALEETYDLIWFMGVFYHLRYPLLALDIISRHASNLVVFQSMTMPDRESYDNRIDIKLDEREVLCGSGWPKMAFIEHSIENDQTNWWVPNNTAVVALMRECGFTLLSTPSHEVFIFKKISAIGPDDIREEEYLAATGLSRNKFMR
jgi:tRNA (mo5U34)-methyltransferase